MASLTITKRPKADGSFSYRCEIIVKKNSKIIHRESKTFRKKELARTYGKKRVQEIESNNIGIRKTVTLGELIDLYIEDVNLWEKTGRTKRYVILMRRDCDIANIQSNRLKTSDLIEHCRMRQAAGAKPVTVYHDISYLRAVMRKAQPVFDIEANTSIFDEALYTLVDMGLIGKSNKRTRRPTQVELDKLKAGLISRQKSRTNSKDKIPYIDMLEFSILTCMRIGEICNLKWDDLNIGHKTILVRDRKDPRKKEGNHMIVPLLGDSFDIIMKQTKYNELIFPFKPTSVTAGFQRVRSKLGIEDCVITT